MYGRPSFDKYMELCLLDGIDLPLINQRWNAFNLVVPLEVKESVDSESQVTLDKISDSACALYFVLSF